MSVTEEALPKDVTFKIRTSERIELHKIRLDDDWKEEIVAETWEAFNLRSQLSNEAAARDNFQKKKAATENMSWDEWLQTGYRLVENREKAQKFHQKLKAYMGTESWDQLSDQPDNCTIQTTSESNGAMTPTTTAANSIATPSVCGRNLPEFVTIRIMKADEIIILEIRLEDAWSKEIVCRTWTGDLLIPRDVDWSGPYQPHIDRPQDIVHGGVLHLSNAASMPFGRHRTVARTVE
ncbi:hypothetical protein KEM56_001168 [Ascosphaera pollenicola]|nr:hypothetical protein KEM56_001168 [Ascosphaera pollenicola]